MFCSCPTSIYCGRGLKLRGLNRLCVQRISWRIPVFRFWVWRLQCELDGWMVQNVPRKTVVRCSSQDLHPKIGPLVLQDFNIVKTLTTCYKVSHNTAINFSTFRLLIQYSILYNLTVVKKMSVKTNWKWLLKKWFIMAHILRSWQSFERDSKLAIFSVVEFLLPHGPVS